MLFVPRNVTHGNTVTHSINVNEKRVEFFLNLDDWGENLVLRSELPISLCDGIFIPDFYQDYRLEGFPDIGNDFEDQFFVRNRFYEPPWRPELRRVTYRQLCEIGLQLTIIKHESWAGGGPGAYAGPVVFKQIIPLYADWDYFEKQHGGISGFGISFVAGASLSWENSLASRLERLAKKVRPTTITTLLSNNQQYNPQAVFRGIPYVRFGDRHTLIFIGDDGFPKETYEMEGAIWHSCVFADRRVLTFSELQIGEWIRVLLRKESFLFPLELWTRIRSSLIVIGELFDHSKDNPELGSFLKARAIFSCQ